MTTEESSEVTQDQLVDVKINPVKYVDMLLRVPAMPLAQSLLYAAQYKLFRRLAINDGTSYSEDEIVNTLEDAYTGDDLVDNKSADETFLTTLVPERGKSYSRDDVWRELRKGKANKDQARWSAKEIVDVRLQTLNEHIFASLAIDTGKTYSKAQIIYAFENKTGLLSCPSVAEVRGRNALDRRDIATGATIAIAAWAGIKEGQRIWLRCEGIRADGSVSDRDLFPSPRTVTSAEVTDGLRAPLPFDYVDDLGDYGQLRVIFKAALDGGADESSAVVFPVLALDIPKCVALSVRPAVTSEEWVLHTSATAPSISTAAGYLALSTDEGPTTLVYDSPSPSRLRATVADSRGVEHAVNLRARRLPDGSRSYGINSFCTVLGRPFNTYFRIQYLPSDNPDLPTGAHKGRLVLQLTGKHLPRVIESIFVDIDITV
ncbi:hypothetical protein [Luteibacter yeojuensis]